MLYLGRMYDAGDTLPANDQKMVTAWLNAKSAAWDGQEAGERHQEAKEDAGQADGSQDSRGQSGGQEAQENGQEAEMLEGHLDAEQLATMKRPTWKSWPASWAWIFPAQRTTRNGRS